MTGFIRGRGRGVSESMKSFTLAALAASILAPAAAQAATLPRADLTITSAIAVDTAAHTVTLPIHRQIIGGTTAWYVITDASTAGAARKLGVNFAPSLSSIAIFRSAAPDFSPSRTYVASAAGFPPDSATPGGTAPAGYSPFIHLDGAVVNAPVIATGDGPFDVMTHTNTEDRVIAIDTKAMTATLVLARGFFQGKRVYYFSTEASVAVPASVERSTYEPNLAKIGAAIPIGAIVNGPQDESNGQGLAFLALRTPLGSDATAANAASIGSPFNVLSIAPNLQAPYADNGYTPLWSVYIVGTKQTKQITDFSALAPLGKDSGIIVNCPVVAYGDDSY